MRGMNSSDVKRSNRGLILKNIALGRAHSRTELAKITGLTKMTTGNIVQEFISGGLVEESGIIETAATGPARQNLVLSKTAPKIIGMYLSRDKIVFSLGDLSGEIIFKKSVDLLNETENSIEEKIIVGIRELITKGKDKILAIGASIIGPINSEGAIFKSPNFFGIENLEVKKILTENFSYPVVICNDISAAGVAEQLKCGDDGKSFVFVGISNGIGAGIIYKGELMTQNNMFLGEFGHITIDINGEKCPCGNVGCLELYTSSSVLIKRLSKAVGREVTLKDFDDIKDIPGCDDIFCDVAEKLAAGMTTVVNLISPQEFILGYDGYFLPEKYLLQIENIINAAKFSKEGKRILVKKPYYKENSANYGSVASVLREIYRGEILFDKENQ